MQNNNLYYPPLVYSNLPRIQELLTSNDLDLRMTAGEIIALVYELASEINRVLLFQLDIKTI